MRAIAGKKYKHISQLEDFWMNAQNDFEVKKKMHSKLLLDLIQKCKIFSVVDQAKDNGKYLQSTYEKEDKEIKMNWVQMEVTDLKELMKQVLNYTRKWIDVQHQKLKEQNMTMTFNLEARVDDEEDASVRGSTSQTTHSRGSKRKDDHGEKES